MLALSSTRTSAASKRPAPSRSANRIYREGMDQWRHYEPWLGELKDKLGDALTRYRD
jgi:hypothetical protein